MKNHIYIFLSLRLTQARQFYLPISRRVRIKLPSLHLQHRLGRVKKIASYNNIYPLFTFVLYSLNYDCIFRQESHRESEWCALGVLILRFPGATRETCASRRVAKFSIDARITVACARAGW